MNIFIIGYALSIEYYDACANTLPDGLNPEELRDFINAYDGCAFE